MIAAACGALFLLGVLPIRVWAIGLETLASVPPPKKKPIVCSRFVQPSKGVLVLKHHGIQMRHSPLSIFATCSAGIGMMTGAVSPNQWLGAMT